MLIIPQMYISIVFLIPEIQASVSSSLFDIPIGS